MLQKVFGVSLIVAMVAMVAGGCQSSNESGDHQLMISTPLEHDPTDEFEIGPWWSDGEYLMNLRPDGGYSIFANNNRYSRPIDRGRWGQQNYATMWLEPYAGLQPQRIRVQITRRDGRLTLIVPKFKPMIAITRPPQVLEDRLLGRWQGTMGLLVLNRDGGYDFTPATAAAPTGRDVMVGHSGRWSLQGRTLALVPATPSIGSLDLTVRPIVDGNEAAGDADAEIDPDLKLIGLGGELVKIGAAST